MERIGAQAIIGLFLSVCFASCQNDEAISSLEQTTVPSIKVGDLTVNEGETGFISVTLSKPATESIEIFFETEDDVAVSGSDYVANSGLITVAPGDQVIEIEVSAIEDGDVEGDESFSLIISPPNNATISFLDTYKEIVILDND